MVKIDLKDLVDKWQVCILSRIRRTVVAVDRLSLLVFIYLGGILGGHYCSEVVVIKNIKFEKFTGLTIFKIIFSKISLVLQIFKKSF